MAFHGKVRDVNNHTPVANVVRRRKAHLGTMLYVMPWNVTSAVARHYYVCQTEELKQIFIDCEGGRV